MLRQVIHVRDALHGYTHQIARLALRLGPTVDDGNFEGVDFEPVQPVALDHTWAAVIGLVANLDQLTAAIEAFPADRWRERGVLPGRPRSAVEWGNDALHVATHHLSDIERLARRSGVESALDG
jgi:hypothetical protein